MIQKYLDSKGCNTKAFWAPLRGFAPGAYILLKSRYDLSRYAPTVNEWGQHLRYLLRRVRHELLSDVEMVQK